MLNPEQANSKQGGKFIRREDRTIYAMYKVVAKVGFWGFRPALVENVYNY